MAQTVSFISVAKVSFPKNVKLIMLQKLVENCQEKHLTRNVTCDILDSTEASTEERGETEMEKLIAKAMEMTVEQIVEAVTIIGGGDNLNRDVYLVRCALLTAYERKTSGEEVDALMDVLGM